MLNIINISIYLQLYTNGFSFFKKLNSLIENSDLLQVTELLDTLQNILVIIFLFNDIKLQNKCPINLHINFIYFSVPVLYFTTKKYQKKKRNASILEHTVLKCPIFQDIQSYATCFQKKKNQALLSNGP